MNLKRFSCPIFIITLLVTGLVFFFGIQEIDKATSSDASCMSCHVHPHAENSWKISSHHNNKSGVIVHCIDCHLPPKDHRNYWPEKIKAASRDLYSYYFRDTEQINWEQKSTLEHAKHHTFREACIKCHENLFPLHLSKKGDEAHLYYKYNQDKLDCINCHLGVGHGEKKAHLANTEFLKSKSSTIAFEQSKPLTKFANFNEAIPGTAITFEMIAIPILESMHNDLKAQANSNGLLPFLIGKTEVSWDEYQAFLSETESEGRLSNELVKNNIDAISGATPPFGDPSQGWGMGKRPAITMTWHAAKTYCQWLSKKTGKTYRLPTEAEWEYACRAGSSGDFFFGDNASEYESKSLIRKLFYKQSDTINKYVIWKGNSNGKTDLPEKVLPNQFGLLNTLGNVKEFCSDTVRTDQTLEHVIKGGSFKSSVQELSLSFKDHTQHNNWLITDPQIPKSLWWYSDCNDVGFRVVCEWSPVNQLNNTK